MTEIKSNITCTRCGKDILYCTCENSIRTIKKENEVLKTILLDVFKLHGELCHLCEKKGQVLCECKCMKDDDCLNHIMVLYKEKGQHDNSADDERR